MPEEVPEDPARLRRVRGEPARRERVRHHEVPVRAVAGRGEPVERPLLRRQLVGHESEPSCSRLDARATAGRSARSIDTGERARPRGVRRIAGRAPDAPDREQPLHRLDLAGDAVDVVVLEVGRERLGQEPTASRPERSCRAAMRLTETVERGRLGPQELRSRVRR